MVAGLIPLALLRTGPHIQMGSSMWAGIRVIIAEIYEFIFQTKYSPRGSMKYLPGPKSHLPMLK